MLVEVSEKNPAIGASTPHAQQLAWVRLLFNVLDLDLDPVAVPARKQWAAIALFVESL
ncbi:hypothetical protein [Gloeobacter morelensis]|uniref:hypothetical protein n=1 Tax=Gloeobacter morelensis TaxID=2907343 RepID=UPI001E574912|nr:hypothetical protein [Gloeobacter morelensis]UFP97120.1 hypothetical protein ISF26_23655 [Gloeobacter morelensis MG652769]